MEATEKEVKSKVRYATIKLWQVQHSNHAARPYMTMANEKAHEKGNDQGRLACSGAGRVKQADSMQEILESTKVASQRAFTLDGVYKPDILHVSAAAQSTLQ